MVRKLRQERTFYEFDQYSLDVTQRVLLRDGELIPLAPKVLDLLLALIETQGRVVGKEELLKRVWPDTFVEEGSLTQNISILRKTLGENGGGPQYIQTVSKRGYRFVAHLKLAEGPEPQLPTPIVDLEHRPAHDPDPTPQARPWRWGLIGAAALALVGIALAVNMGTRSKPKISALQVRSVDPTAYEAYLKGQYWVERKGEENLIKGRAYLEQATEKDPAYALAWAGLADAYVGLANWGVIPYRDALPRARATAEKALELDNSLVGPLVALAAVKLLYEWDWAGTELLCKRAIDLKPNYGRAHHVYSTYLMQMGRTRGAVAEARRAREVEPLAPEFQANVVWKLYLARQYDEAESEARRVSSLYPGFSLGYVRASLYMQTARQREAVAVLKQTVVEWGRGSLVLMYLAHGLGVAGARAEGQHVLDEMLERERTSYVPPDHIAMAYEGLGQREQALRWYEKAFAERSINWWILPDPQLDSLRADPRFQALLRKTGLPRQASSDQLSQ